MLKPSWPAFLASLSLVVAMAIGGIGRGEDESRESRQDARSRRPHTLQIRVADGEPLEQAPLVKLTASVMSGSQIESASAAEGLELKVAVRQADETRAEIHFELSLESDGKKLKASGNSVVGLGGCVKLATLAGRNICVWYQ